MARALNADELCWKCTPDDLDFDSTAELTGTVDSIGQDRADEALRFGLGMGGQGWNIFVLGPPGSGRTTLVERSVEPAAAGPADVSAWCYVHNFDESHKPRLLRMAPGRGHELAKDMASLVEELRTAIPSVFETDEYRNRKSEIEEELKQKQEEGFQEVSDEAEEAGIKLLQTPMGFAMAPVKDGEIVKPDEFSELPEEEQKRIEGVVEGLQKKLHEIVREAPLWKRDAEKKIKELNRELTDFAVQHLIDERRARYTDNPQVMSWLDAVQADVVDSAPDFLRAASGKPEGPLPFMQQPSFERYEVNVLVDPEDASSAPVIQEPNPNFENLVGRVEHRAQFGTLTTDFRLIKPGALHKANGGYLILDARRLLLQPYAWEALKRALVGRVISVESAARMLGLASTVSLEPEPIPLDVKVILVGTRDIYYMLEALDPDFDRLFKVAVDLEDDIPRAPGTIHDYAVLLANMVRDKELLPLNKAAVGRVLEHAVRLAGDRDKLSVGLGRVVDLLHEADFHARQAGVEHIERDHVQAALDSADRRVGRIKERIRESILRDTIYVHTDGAEVGQINGLSVLQLGSHAFGQPNRITATCRLGEGQVVDIEREVRLGGAFHTKGVLILSSFLASRYAQTHPLSLRASLVFEQSYGRIDGDSASMAELCVLLSALSGMPIKQGIAITGSVDQRGRAQPIGGVNEKIEGFFAVCAERGLTGEQGVIIPAANTKHLVLRSEVVEAVRDGRFHVWAMEDVDDAIARLTGLPAGDKDVDGAWEKDGINDRVERRLDELWELRSKLGRPDEDDAPGRRKTKSKRKDGAESPAPESPSGERDDTGDDRPERDGGPGEPGPERDDPGDRGPEKDEPDAPRTRELPS